MICPADRNYPERGHLIEKQARSLYHSQILERFDSSDKNHDIIPQLIELPGKDDIFILFDKLNIELVRCKEKNEILSMGKRVEFESIVFNHPFNSHVTCYTSNDKYYSDQSQNTEFSLIAMGYDRQINLFHSDMLEKDITVPSQKLLITSPVTQMQFLQNHMLMNLVSLHEDNRLQVTSLRTKTTVYSLDLTFTPTHLAIDPNLNFMVITGNTWDAEVKNKEENEFVAHLDGEPDQGDASPVEDSRPDMLKISLRIKDTWKFNLNDAFIESFIHLPNNEAHNKKEQHLL